MDYKFIILIVVMLGIILFFMKEMDNLKKNIETNFNNVSKIIDNNGEKIRHKIQADISTCLTKVKSYNSDCIQQIRKIDTLGAQPILNMSNHYTDGTCSNSQHSNSKKMKCLSDTKPSDNDSCYMSSDSGAKHKHHVKPIQQATPIQQQNNKFEINYNDKQDKTYKMDKQDKTDKSVKTPVLDKKMNNIQVDLNNMIVEKKDTEPTTEASDDTEESSESEESVEIDEIHEIDDSETSSDHNKVENKKVVKCDDLGEEKIDDAMRNEYEYESITLGSLKGKDGINPKLSLSKLKPKCDEGDTDSETVAQITKNNFKNMNNYNTEALKKIAKTYNIQITKDNGGIRKSLTKTELYNSIKQYLDGK